MSNFRKERNEHYLTGDEELDEELFTITFNGLIHFHDPSRDKEDHHLDEQLVVDPF